MFKQLARWFQEEAQAEPASEESSNLAAATPPPALKVFLLHPVRLAGFLEEAWFARVDRGERPSLALFDPVLPPSGAPPGRVNSISGIGGQLTHVGSDIYDPGVQPETALWDHLIYAYMIENTRIYEIFRRVLYEYRHGERLSVASVDGQHWLRATEDLFYRDPLPFTISSLTGYVRPDLTASRRNAYWRMFGMDLNHGTGEGAAYPYEKAEAANREFVPTFEALLRETWRGIENWNNTTGANPTDDSAIANIALQLFNMLTARRGNGTMSREEFFFVSMMSWFHLTVMFNSPIVEDLRAQAPSPEERLRLIGERVGIPAHAASASYFRMAEPLSAILTLLERGKFNEEEGARTLYADTPTGNLIRSDMMKIITHWSVASGRSMKALPVSPSATAMVGGTVRSSLPA